MSPLEKKPSDPKIEEEDQLKVIVNSLGQCDEFDTSFITNPKARKYFTFLNESAPARKMALLHNLMNLKDKTL